MIIDLSFKELPIGAQVKTKKGFIFTKLGADHWRDETAHLDWLPGEKTNISQYEAEKLGTLPTQKQFIEAEEHGIRELFDMHVKWYWSSTPYRDNADDAYVFNGDNGYAYYHDNRNDSVYDVAARFVSEVNMWPRALFLR